jgi:excisionase family DNA binding protein
MIGQGLSRTDDSAASRWDAGFLTTEVALVDRSERLVLSVPEAAGMLGISRRLAYELAARGDLPVLRLGGRVLILRRPFERLLDGER